MTREEVLKRVGAIMRLPAIRIVAENGYVQVFKLQYNNPDYLILTLYDDVAIIDGIKHDIREEV